MNDNNKSEPATKADLATGLAELKTGLNERIDTLGIELAKTQADVREIKYDIATKLSTKDDISRLMNHIDAFAAEASTYRNHDALRGGKITEHGRLRSIALDTA